MLRRHPRFAAVLAVFAAATVGNVRAQSESAAAAEAAYRRHMAPFLKTNCLVCHDAQRQSGDLNLVPFDKLSALSTHREDWKLILQMIESGEMPPSEMPANKIPP